MGHLGSFMLSCHVQLNDDFQGGAATCGQFEGLGSVSFEVRSLSRTAADSRPNVLFAFPESIMKKCLVCIRTSHTFH